MAESYRNFFYNAKKQEPSPFARIPELMKALAFCFGLLLCTAQFQAQVLLQQSDRQPLHDPMRPVMELGRDYAVLQYFTATPCETRVQIRADNLPMTAWGPPDKKADPWSGSSMRVISDGSGKISTYHRIEIKGLKPGTRYYYRFYDPGAKPTSQESNWGAVPPWRREYAFATLAPKGRKSIVHLPVKVLLMPNVINVASAHDATGAIAKPPSKMTGDEIARLKEEYAITARYFWVNSGMRLWVDFHLFVDDRWQRWGEEPANVDAFYRGWVVCRSYPGKDFAAPGGGDFTIVDTSKIMRINKEPIYEAVPYAGQIEQSFPRRWDNNAKNWIYYNSGGGTYGVDGFPQGVPARSQFLGGGDTAWLACHEFHHQMESYGAFSLSNREDERIIFNHPEPRKRETRPDGSVQESTWNTSGRHGEHWNVMAFWDRTLTDIQWLRLYFGQVITVADADEDGFPDEDARLPLDEKRFGSSPRKPATDGAMNDLQKAMLSTWAPACLQYTFIKPPFQSVKPNPSNRDTDGDGLPDTIDPYPLYPWQPFVWAMRATVDGEAVEWNAVPPAGELNEGGVQAVYKHAHDETAYYGHFTLKGDWKRVYVGFDGEGLGIFSQVGIQFIEVLNNDTIEVKPMHGSASGLQWKASRKPDGTSIVEFSFPNRGAGKWYWTRGGREIGVSIDVFNPAGTGYSLYEPYALFYCRMLEPNGQFPMPANAPPELSQESAEKVLKPGDPALKLTGTGWQVRNAVLEHSGHEESVIYIDGLEALEFDLWIEFEATQDGILAAFVPKTTSMNAGQDYVLFAGGYGNSVTRFRLFGREEGDSDVMMTPGRHRLQFSRRAGSVWALMDGKPILHAPDPNPKQPVNRLAIIGGYSGNQKIYEIRYRIGYPS